MLPVPSLQRVIETWETLRSYDVRLLGFLLYTKSHDTIYHYVREKEGLFALDEMLRGEWASQCGIFVFEPSTSTWRQWAELKDHVWCKVYCHQDTCPWRMQRPQGGVTISELGDDPLDERVVVHEAMIAQANAVQVYDEANSFSMLEEYFHPSYFDAFDVAQHFNLKYEEIPCLILFTDLKQSHKGHFRLKDVRDDNVANEFQRLFQRDDFSRVARDAGCGK